MLLAKFLKHELVVLVQGLVDVFEKEVVVREGGISRFHEIFKVLVVQRSSSILSLKGTLRVKDLRSVKVLRGGTLV